MEIFTKCAQDTQNLGQKIGNNLTKRHPGGPKTDLPAGRQVGSNSLKQAKILAFYGQLGSGKTTFIQGLTKGLGLPDRIISPTYIIIKRYLLNKSYKYLYHLDLYRLFEVNFDELGLFEIFSDPNNLVVIEWADKLKNNLPKTCTKIYFEIISENKRKITIS